MEKQSGNWNTVAEYKYDGKTRRVLKVVSNKGDLNGTTRFVWGGQSDWQCLEERDGSGNLVARFTYAPGYIDAPARQERDLNSDDDFGDDDEVVWYHSNTLYSVYALTDGSENVVERYRYDAYGACTVLDADYSADSDGISDVSNAYAFTARRLDAESGLMQYRHRFFIFTLGRFLSRDPMGHREDPNSYGYCKGRPTNVNDPVGLTTVCTGWSRRAFASCKQGTFNSHGVGVCPKTVCYGIKYCREVECVDGERRITRRWYVLRKCTISLEKQWNGRLGPPCYRLKVAVPIPLGYGQAIDGPTLMVRCWWYGEKDWKLAHEEARKGCAQKLPLD